jgi:hypothetical protein
MSTFADIQGYKETQIFPTNRTHEAFPFLSFASSNPHNIFSFITPQISTTIERLKTNEPQNHHKILKGHEKTETLDSGIRKEQETHSPATKKERERVPRIPVRKCVRKKHCIIVPPFINPPRVSIP